MTILRRAADTVHKTVATGLFGLTGFGLYTVTNQALEGKTVEKKEERHQSGFLHMIRSKAEEEYRKYYDIDHREWYDKDDNSYLKKLSKPEDYEQEKKH